MGGMERASSNLANFFASRGHEVIYIAMFRYPRFFSLDPSVKYYEPEKAFKRLPILQTIIRIRKQVKAFAPNTVLVFNKFFSSLVLLALIGTSMPVYISERSSPLYKWPRKISVFNRLAFWLKSPTGVIAQTRIAASYQQTYFGKHVSIAVIHNSVRAPVKLKEVERENWVLGVGRLTDHHKGLDRLIEAFSHVQARDWKLVIAGGDEQGQHLKEQAKRLGIEDSRIQFLGKVHDMNVVYQTARIFVIPSRSEGFPNALCEAMVSGLPCISFDFTAGPGDLIEDGVNGVLVPNGDIRQLANKIEYLIWNEEVREGLGRNATQVIHKLREDIVGERFLDFILPQKIDVRN